MEASLKRKESKRRKSREEAEVDLVDGERTKERKHRKKRDAKRKKKRSLVPNLDDEQNTRSLGQDNQGLNDDETINVSNRADIDKITSQRRSEVGPQYTLDKSVTSISSQGSVDATVSLEQDDQSGLHENGSKSDQSLRRRATLTEIGQSFDEDVDDNKVSLKVML